MDVFIKVIKSLINGLMTLIIIVGVAFIALYLAGIEPFVVESGSMEPTIHKGSLCFINKHADYHKIENNDIIAFTISTGDKVTHRVINVTNEGIETKGDSNSKSDGISTTKKNFIGKNVFSIPKAGYVVKLIQTKNGKIVLGTIIVILFLSAFFMGDNKKGKRFKTDGE